MLKLIPLIAALMFGGAAAQSQGDANLKTYYPEAATEYPTGATGAGIVSTGTVKGHVIYVGAPVIKNVPVGQKCANDGGRGCMVIFEKQIVGYGFTAQYGYVQVDGVMPKKPYVGQEVSIIVKQIIYAGS